MLKRLIAFLVVLLIAAPSFSSMVVYPGNTGREMRGSGGARYQVGIVAMSTSGVDNTQIPTGRIVRVHGILLTHTAGFTQANPFIRSINNGAGVPMWTWTLKGSSGLFTEYHDVDFISDGLSKTSWATGSLNVYVFFTPIGFSLEDLP